MNSASRYPGGRWKEHLHQYRDLLIWSRQVGSLPLRRFRSLARLARSHPRKADAVLERARELREATFRIFFSLAHRAAPDARDLTTINRELGRGLAHAQVERSGSGFQWSWQGESDSLETPLWPIVRSVADLLTSSDHERVLVCASDDCEWLFLDRTKNRARRWCEMKVCGNRAKVREHRKRHRKREGTGDS